MRSAAKRPRGQRPTYPIAYRRHLEAELVRIGKLRSESPRLAVLSDIRRRIIERLIANSNWSDDEGGSK